MYLSHYWTLKYDWPCKTRIFSTQYIFRISSYIYTRVCNKEFQIHVLTCVWQCTQWGSFSADVSQLWTPTKTNNNTFTYNFHKYNIFPERPMGHIVYLSTTSQLYIFHYICTFIHPKKTKQTKSNHGNIIL